MTELDNSVRLLLERAQAHPTKDALQIPTTWNEEHVTQYETVSYQDIVSRARQFQLGLKQEGLKSSNRVILMVPPSIDLYCLVVALLASGMVVVFVDPNMGLKKVLMAFNDSNARMLISGKKLLRLRWLLPNLWKVKCLSVDGPGFFYRGLDVIELPLSGSLEVMPCNKEHQGLISFTSGSTGRPKGADRTQGSLWAQHEALSAHLGGSKDDIDLTCLPVLALHNMGNGWTTVFPAMEMGKPGSINGRLVSSQIKALGVSRITGAPAFMERLADYALSSGESFPSVTSITAGGAPVSQPLCRKLKDAFVNARIEVLYGSTEAEPISGVFDDEYLSAKGKGHLVGLPVPQIQVVAVQLPMNPDDITDSSLDTYKVKLGDVGEIVIKGKHVLKGYIDNPKANRENKIPCDDGLVWHRTGDTGFLDEGGRIWLTGRLADVIAYQGQYIQPYQIEMAIDALEGVRRSAIILPQHRSKPSMAVTLMPGVDEAVSLKRISETLGNNQLSDITVHFLAEIPVDNRHNSKIDRIKLRESLA
ncbi:hypothetical protein A9Q81_06040 [Gammaproteobacteria bacterium 42_54_T18]|nr:hypothetical protein A9Q81_06040 [Gammaproteobacteria bacterium 42_54_T18]